MPVTRQPKVLAMYRAGPPMPQPMSSTRSPDAAPSASPTKRLASLPPMWNSSTALSALASGRSGSNPAAVRPSRMVLSRFSRV